MDVEEYEPISTLKVPQHPLTHSKFPFIDVHNHQWTMPVQDLDKLVVEMDSLNMGVMVNLSGFRGKYLEWSLDNVNENYPKRFILFNVHHIVAILNFANAPKYKAKKNKNGKWK